MDVEDGLPSSGLMVQSLLFVLFPPRPRGANVATAFPTSWAIL